MSLNHLLVTLRPIFPFGTHIAINSDPQTIQKKIFKTFNKNWVDKSNKNDRIGEKIFCTREPKWKLPTVSIYSPTSTHINVQEVANPIQRFRGQKKKHHVCIKEVLNKHKAKQNAKKSKRTYIKSRWMIYNVRKVP